MPEGQIEAASSVALKDTLIRRAVCIAHSRREDLQLPSQHWWGVEAAHGVTSRLVHLATVLRQEPSGHRTGCAEGQVVKAEQEELQLPSGQSVVLQTIGRQCLARATQVPSPHSTGLNPSHTRVGEQRSDV